MSWGTLIETDLLQGKHRYCTFKPTDMSAWLKAMAGEYVKLRTECTIDVPDVLDISSLGSFDSAQLKSRLAAALVPPDDTHKKHFSVTRSDLSEVAAYLLLERKFGTQIAYKPVRDRELISLPGRGIDAIGIEQDEKLIVVLGEVKFSDENSSPKSPKVVDKQDDGMRNQHLGHLKDLANTSRKLWDCARRAKDRGVQAFLMSAAVCLEDGAHHLVDVISCCILVRPEHRHCDGDFGTFKSSPQDFAPAHVRFLVWVLPEEIEKILSDWTTAIEAEKAAA